MARQKVGEHGVRKLTRTGRGASMSLTLPIEHVRALGWKDKQKVVVTRRGSKLIVEDWKE